MNEEAEKWMKRALEAARAACENCEEYMEGRKKCRNCRIEKIFREAEAEWTK